MSDVARLAGVSLPTVSRVINGGHWVRAETAARVEQAVQQLGYRPNATARALAHGGVDVIGVLSHPSVAFGPASIVVAVEQAARAAGYTTMLTNMDRFDLVALQGAVDRLAESGAAGIVIAAIWTDDAPALNEITCSVPIVLAEHVKTAKFRAVGFDEVTACRDLVDHLLALGHRTVHHVAGAPGWSGSIQREEGWRQSLEAASAPVPPVTAGDWTSERGFAAAGELLERGDVTAVFAANDQTALGLVAGFHAHGVAVPVEMSVAGFDALPDSAFYLPALTSVRNDYQKHAQRVVAALLDSLDQVASGDPPQGPAPVLELVAAELVLRASTAPPPVSGPPVGARDSCEAEGVHHSSRPAALLRSGEGAGSVVRPA